MLKTKTKLFLVTLLSMLFVFLFGSATQLLFIGKASASSQFAMQGASMRLTDVTGMRFEARISEYDEEATYGMMICPTEYLEGVSSDYINELTKKHTAGTIKHLPLVMESTPVKVGESEWAIKGTISSVLYQNLNRNFTGIAFKRTGTEGSYVYEYATTYFDRSIAFISTACWNAKEFAEGTTQLTTLKGMVAQCIALANNQTAEQAQEIIANPASVDAYIQNNVTAVMNDIPTAYYEIGAEQALSATVTPAIGLNVVFATSNDDVIEVKGNVMKVVGNGNATVSVCIGDVVLAEKEITVSALTLTAPEYLAAGKTATVTASDENANVTYTSSNTNILTVEGNTIKGVGNGTATITAKVGDIAVSEVNVRVIDFGNTTGSVLNFATAENLDLWKFRDGSNDGNASISYVTAVDDGTDYDYNAIKYNRPNNTGAYRTIGNFMYLPAEVVQMAKDAGYRYVWFYTYVPTGSGEKPRYYEVYAVEEDGQARYKNGSHMKYLTNTSTGWNLNKIDLESVAGAENTGIGFHTYGKDLYVAMFKFFGADVSSVVTSSFGSLASGMYENMVKEELIGKFFLALNDCQVSFSYAATGGKIDSADAPMVTATRTGRTFAQANTQNSIYLNSEWIMAAKAMGCDKIGIRVKASGAYAFMRVKADGTVKSILRSNGNYESLRISIADFEQGETFSISMGSNTTLSISQITFRTTAHSSAPNLNWPTK